MPPIRNALWILLFASLAAASAAPAGASVSEDLSWAFFRVAFGLEYGGHHSDAQRVKKYVEPVRFHIVNLSSRDRNTAVASFLNELPRKIGNLRVSIVGRDADANFRILLVDRGNFNAVVKTQLRADAVAMGARCLVGVRTSDGKILSSTAVIVADDEYLFHRCLVEEVLQGLGPMNDNSLLPESVFNDTSRLAEFTPFDQALLNMLYHPAIRPGMTGTQVQRALPQVMLDLGLR